ncbi:uncharacterized protein LOC121283135 isoform X1 [Carcharodon carcharias]|uniref:uncharacterized protein LOC121283135 isoform X1 n=1 Tax=Carcharodon carcharias TaxID=13397 RepID=UPI001B7F76C5|nr:uncharacterized protein LOC121283135 isoform X1 [Carcharodon carcharias]XP_041053215.1 uncharacterized protein LOC121283135 isoform X1 [Carcharodon carcharias]
MRLHIWLLAVSAALLQGCCSTPFSYFGASFGLEASLVGDILQVHIYYRGISLPCSQSLDGICVALNCTNSRTQTVGDSNHSTTWCMLDGGIIIHRNNTSPLHIRPTGCCWSSFVGSQREAESLQFAFSLLADLGNRSDNVAINAPPQPPLLPVLRVPQNCTANYNLTIYERDGDILRCHYGLRARHECAHCTQHPFFILDQESCVLQYNGRGTYGTYSIELIIEDYSRETILLTHSDGTQTLHSAFEEASSTSFNQSAKALSSIPMQFVVIVDRAMSECAFGIFRPVFIHPTPPNGARIPASLYDEVTFTISAISLNERITAFTIVGPRGLRKSDTWSVNNDRSLSANVSWSVGVYDAPKQVPVCFLSITSSGLQSEPQCIWIVLNRVPVERSLSPDLQCLTDAMILSVPRSLVTNLPDRNLQLNDASCNVTGNNTHLLLKIPLSGCGTKLLEDESHYIFTNKIISRRRNKTLTQTGRVAFPITCKFQRTNNSSKDPNLLNNTTERLFGDYSFEIQFSKEFNSSRRTAKVHAPFDANSNDHLYIRVIAKSSVTTLSLYVESCQMSEEFNSSTGVMLLHQGCLNNSTTEEHQTGNRKEKVYSIKLSSLPQRTSQIFVTCNVQLCTNVYNFKPCMLGCGSDNSSQMEQSDMQQVSAGPIHIKKESDLGPNYAAITVGLVLGGTVVYVVLILLKRSFVGLHYRSVTRNSPRTRPF